MGMADERFLEQLLAEFRRAGIDPDTFSAMLAVDRRDALRALQALPDDAGPAAFLKELRRLGVQPAPAESPRTEPTRTRPHDDRATGAA